MEARRILKFVHLSLALAVLAALLGAPGAAHAQLPAFIPMPGVTPEGVAVDRTGDVFVSVRSGAPGTVPHGAIWRYTPDGQASLFASVGNGVIGGLAIAADGDVYVAMATGPDQGVYRIEAAIEQHAMAAPAFPVALGFVAGISRRLGRHDRASEAIAELERLSHSRRVGSLAWVAAYIGEPEYFEWLERAFDEREGWVPLLNTDPNFADLQANPALRALLDRLGLPRVRVSQASLAGTWRNRDGHHG